MTGSDGTGGGSGPIVVDARKLFATLQQLQRGLDQHAILFAIGLRIMGWIDANFRNPIEHHWPPLSKNTVAGRRKGSSAPLQDTGRLKMSWTRAGGNPHVMPGRVEVTSNVRYAKWHERGTGPYVITARPGGRLRFMTASGVRFATKVNHPGIPQRQMTPSVGTTERLARETTQAIFDKLAKQANT